MNAQITNQMNGWNVDGDRDQDGQMNERIEWIRYIVQQPKQTTKTVCAEQNGKRMMKFARRANPKYCCRIFGQQKIHTQTAMSMERRRRITTKTTNRPPSIHSLCSKIFAWISRTASHCHHRHSTSNKQCENDDAVRQNDEWLACLLFIGHFCLLLGCAKSSRCLFLAKIFV